MIPKARNPTSPVVGARTLQEIYGRSMAQTSFALVMQAIAGKLLASAPAGVSR